MRALMKLIVIILNYKMEVMMLILNHMIIKSIRVVILRLM